jgi:hypothetical protein
MAAPGGRGSLRLGKEAVILVFRIISGLMAVVFGAPELARILSGERSGLKTYVRSAGWLIAALGFMTYALSGHDVVTLTLLAIAVVALGTSRLLPNTR